MRQRARPFLTLLSLLGPAAAQPPAPVPCTPAVLSVRLGDLTGFSATRVGRALPAMFAKLFEDAPRDGTLAAFEAIAALARAVQPPLTLDLHGVRNVQHGLALAAVLPADAPPLGDLLRAVWKDEPSAPLELQDANTSLRGARLDFRRGPWFWLDGAWVGQRTALLFSAVEAPPDAWLAGLAAARQRGRRARLDELAAGLGDAPVLLRFDFAAVLRGMPREDAARLHVLTTILGARFAGMVAAIRPDGARVSCEGLFDVGRETGLLGRLLREPARVPPLLARVPADAEFQVFDLDPDGLGDLLRLVKTFAGDQVEDVPLDDILAFVAAHWDGQLAIVTAPSRVEQAIDPEAEEPFVCLLGSPDGHEARAKLLAILEGFGFEVGRLAGGERPGRDDAWPLRLEGETLFQLGAQRDFLALSGTDPESAAILAKIVAAQGKGGIEAQSLPAPLRAGCAFAARISPLSELSGLVVRNDLRGRPMPEKDARALAEVLARHMGDEPTFVGLRADATAMRFWIWQ